MILSTCSLRTINKKIKKMCEITTEFVFFFLKILTNNNNVYIRQASCQTIEHLNVAIV